MASEKILVVDDDPLVRRSLVEMLRLEHYTVSEASTGAEALKVAAAVESG